MNRRKPKTKSQAEAKSHDRTGRAVARRHRYLWLGMMTLPVAVSFLAPAALGQGYAPPPGSGPSTDTQCFPDESEDACRTRLNCYPDETLKACQDRLAEEKPVVTDQGGGGGDGKKDDDDDDKPDEDEDDDDKRDDDDDDDKRDEDDDDDEPDADDDDGGTKPEPRDEGDDDDDRGDDGGGDGEDILRPGTNPAFVVGAVGPTFFGINRFTAGGRARGKVAVDIGYHFSGEFEGPAIGAAIEQTFDNAFYVFNPAFKFWWDIQVVDDMGIYVAPFAKAGYALAACGRFRGACPYHAFNIGAGAEGRLILDDRWVVLFRPIQVDTYLGDFFNNTFWLNYSVLAGGGVSF